MYGPTDQTARDRQRAGAAVQDPVKPVPPYVRYITSSFGLRHANGIAVIRFLVAVWLVCLGSIFCAIGDWWGAFLYVAAALIGAFAYYVPRWKVALDAENEARGTR